MNSVDTTWLVSLFDLSTTALLGVDRNGKVTFWSRGAEDLFGWTADEVRGRVLPIVPLALQQEWRLQMQRVFETAEPTTAAETQRTTRDGRSITVVRVSSPVRDTQGAVSGLLDLLIDATALKQLDDESRALTQVRERELIAMDLHDGVIQSLYAVVLNLAAQEQRLGDAQPAAVEAIKAARAEVERVIGETRAYVSDLRGRAFTPRNLETGLRLLVDGLRLNAGVSVDLRFDPSLEPLLAPEVRGHVLYLVREAVANVLRHAEARHVRIELSRTDGGAVLKVEDDGRGFEAPARLQSTERQRGLHNMAERARLVGGHLDIQSAPGRGTLVRLEFPL
jgi:PAS domain S-box-containing protein